MSAPLRIAVVETAARGGLLHYAVQLADSLAERGNEVDLVVPAGHELAGRPGAARRVEKLYAPVRTHDVPSGPAARLARRAGIAARLMATWIRTVLIVRRGGYDAVVIDADMGLAPVAAVGVALQRMPGGPVLSKVAHNVRTYNRWGGDDVYESSRLLLGLLGRLYSGWDAVFVHGARSRRLFEETWPPTRRLAEIPHGDERVFADAGVPPAAPEPRILFFGEWRKPKGLDLLMEAFDLLAARRPEVLLTIAGAPAPQDMDPEVVRRWAEGHGDRVDVRAGYVPMEEVPAVFGSARVVVCPYRAAAQSGVIHLAMTLGRAVVATDVGDFGDSVRDGLTGRLVEPGDATVLAGALEEVVCDPEKAAAYGETGAKWVREHVGWERVAERVEATLRDAVRER